MGGSHDQSLVNKILEVSKDVDRKVAECRGESTALFSFLADQVYGEQVVYLSSSPAPTSGSFYLSFAGQVTSTIPFDADGPAVQSLLEALSTIGSGNVTVSGFSGGPWTVQFAGALVGPQPRMTGAADFAGGSVAVLPTIDGCLQVPSERRFTPEPPLYGRLLKIDDCVEVLGARLYDEAGNVTRRYVEGVDYVLYPMRGTPIEALKSLDPNGWPEWPFTIGVESRWGHRLTIPDDVREGTVIEVIRSHFAALAGNDDRIGLTPFQSVVTSKAFTSKFHELVEDYGKKLW